MVDGFTNGSDSDIAGNSIGKPPACSTPRFTSSARSRRCVWQKLMSLQVLMMPMTGLTGPVGGIIAALTQAASDAPNAAQIADAEPAMAAQIFGTFTCGHSS